MRAYRVRWPQLCVVVMTGRDPGSALDTMTGPAPVLLNKPFTAASLRNAVNTALTTSPVAG